MEDYKKKYEEAVQRAMDYASGKYPEALVSTKAAVELIFPELKESEDKRIRKELLEHCRKQADIYNTLHTAKEYSKVQSWVAWLEKQGDVDKRIQEEIEKRTMQQRVCERQDYPYQPGWRKNSADNKPAKKHSVLMLTTHGVAEGEWLGEDWCQYRWSCNVKDSEVLFWIHLSDLERLEKEGEQKAAWSDGDENIKDIILSQLRSDNFSGVLGKSLLEASESWLSSLQNRVQTRQEWSEEDEYCRHQLIVFCKNCMAQDDDAKKCANWLKSLKPQSHWKPSEEQIEVLQDTIRAYNEVSFPTEFRVLSSLCNQLKKLSKEQS